MQYDLGMIHKYTWNIFTSSIFNFSNPIVGHSVFTENVTSLSRSTRHPEVFFFPFTIQWSIELVRKPTSYRSAFVVKITVPFRRDIPRLFSSLAASLCIVIILGKESFGRRPPCTSIKLTIATRNRLSSAQNWRRLDSFFPLVSCHPPTLHLRSLCMTFRWVLNS